MFLGYRVIKSALFVFVGILLSLSTTAAQSWIQLAPSGTPPPYGLGPGVFDPATDRMVAFGNGDPHSLWALSNANDLGGTPQWSQFAPLPDPVRGFPPVHSLSSAVYDATNNRLITFGGCLASCGSPVNDVWVLTNANGLGGSPTWLKLLPAGGPPAARASHAAVYDAASNRMIIFGGQNGCCAIPPTFSDTWVLTNANGLGGPPTWTQLGPTGGPPPGQSDVTAVYDSASNRMTVFGGGPNLSPTPTNAVWVLSNANGLGGAPAWTNLVPEGATGAPPRRLLGAGVYDPDLNRMTIFGGWDPSSNTFFNDTWVLTNANGLGAAGWTQLFPTGGPPSARLVDVGVLDVVSNRMITFGGANSAGVLTDTWVLNLEPDDDSQFSLLNGGNTFTGNQTVNGTVAATSFVGNGSGLTGVAADTAKTANFANNANFANAANVANTAGFATSAGTAANASSLGNVPAGSYARLDIGNNFSGNQTVSGDLSASGNVAVTGSARIGGGTPIVEHLSATPTVTVPPIAPSNCFTISNVSVPGATDGDTLALGVKNSLVWAGSLNYFAWVSATNIVTIRVCNFKGGSSNPQITGIIRVDIWKH